ncbi:hypothetical protein IC757_13915 [Wenzhouxiangella sp. AB-CW3]|uniref:LPS-assembly lipoprotein LptE n=1 Tax=Wenzhouxiangella sp. AB-CW3 TaxID=2771012 RepID=UPI00168A5DF0|nr:LPS assembly lipoprotein LptE [Wenzhouxiangella sp. AB-CW3]QOC22104.1 hypothetical protein IC757_13915 [Wenzhouxiangella sp. AB-CW3]
MPLRALSLLLFCLVLAACGFQLRGEARLPAVMGSTWLEVSDAGSDFGRDLARQLEANGIRVLDAHQDGAAHLKIHREQIRREALTFTGQARVREFLLIYDMAFELRDAQGDTLVGPETLQLTREYSFDEQEILAAQREQEFLEDDLRRAMVARLLRRLEAVTES